MRERKTHKQQLSELDAWQIDGKVGIRARATPAAAPCSGCSARATTTSACPARSAAARARLTGREGAVSLEVAGQGRYQAESPEALLEEQLGWRLPVSHLLWWVRGLPAPDSKSRLTLDADSRLARLEQDGWQIEYTRYAEQNGYWLPERLKLHGQDLDVTLVIKDWQPRQLGR
ncbi:lipoprotein insertase outer membrane protein LolB [Pseudomonas aeruginosa]|nr:lipoprotein insertase outer membrane protein LolB [Pseudomonas aeruginosa]